MKHLLILVGLFVLLAGAVAVSFRLRLFGGSSEVQEAALRKNWGEVDRLVAAGADPTKGFGGGKGTILHLAARFAPPDTVRALLEAGCDPNARDGSGDTPLHQAVRGGNLENVRLLVDHGADLGLTNKQGLTSAALARMLPYDNVSELLSEHHAPLQWGAQGTRQLGVFILEGDLDGVRQVLDGGQSPDVTITGGLSAYRTALLANRPKVAQLLLDRGANPGPINAPDSALYAIAIGKSDTEVVELLLQFGIDPNGLTREGVSPLVAAEARGLDDIAAVLAEHGARRRWDGVANGRLFAAVLDGGDEEVKAALAAGDDANGSGPNGITPLHLAVLKDRPPILQILLDAGADPDAKNANGLMALHMAADAGNLQIAKLLLEHGASVNAEDRDATTPLAHAEKAGHAEVAALLKEHGGRDTAAPMGLQPWPLQKVQTPAAGTNGQGAKNGADAEGP